MADIDIERKGPGIWPWIIGLLVLALLIWGVAEMFDSDPEVALDDPAAAPVVPLDPVAPPNAAMPPAVNAYLTDCTEELGPAAGDMGLEHEYTVNCLQQLHEGMNALVTEQQVPNTDVSARMDDYTTAVQQLQDSDPTAATHANLTREAAGTGVALMQAIQAAWYPAAAPVEAAVDEVEQAAEGIQGDVQMLEQRESVRTFFREAGDALRIMAENRTVGA